jgi:hypothetical protein
MSDNLTRMKETCSTAGGQPSHTRYGWLRRGA